MTISDFGLKWDQRFLRHALGIADWSKDNSTQVGCVIVGPDREIRTTGYNGMPRGVCDDLEHRHQRPTKYMYYEHAERNAIYNAARMGVSLKDCTLYVTSKPSKFPPCADCARAVIQCGITRVIQEPASGEAGERWGESCQHALQMFEEAGVMYRQVDLSWPVS